MVPAYVPDSHWTSRSRNDAGYKPFLGNQQRCSTCTISDVTGVFTRLILSHEYKPAGSWKKFSTYHIEVDTSESDILSLFSLGPYQVKMVGAADDFVNKILC
jgi:hypothetical protein